MSQNNHAVDKDLLNLISQIQAGNYQQVQNILRSPNQDLVNKTHPQTHQPSLYFAALIKGDQLSSEFIKLLIRYGANVKFKDANDQTVLFYVCREGNQKCAQILLSQGLNLDQMDVYGQTPIFYAVSQNKLQIVKKYGTKNRANHADNLANQTPLYYAARRGHLQMCKILVQKGGDIHHLDSTNKTAIQYAKKAKCYEVVQYLANEMKKIKQDTVKYNLPSQSLDESNIQRKKKKEDPVRPIRQTYKIVFFNQKGQSHDLTEQQVRQLIKQKPILQNYLANPDIIPQDLLQSSNGDNWQKIALKILTQCIKLKGSYWFMEPVDPIKYNILDYFDIIRNPMDLGTVKKKLSHNCYLKAEEFIDDMTLVWQNCFTYNGQIHQISKCAKQLQISFKEYITQYGLDKYIGNSR